MSKRPMTLVPRTYLACLLLLAAFESIDGQRPGMESLIGHRAVMVIDTLLFLSFAIAAIVQLWAWARERFFTSDVRT